MEAKIVVIDKTINGNYICKCMACGNGFGHNPQWGLVLVCSLCSNRDVIA